MSSLGKKRKRDEDEKYSKWKENIKSSFGGLTEEELRDLYKVHLDLKKKMKRKVIKVVMVIVKMRKRKRKKKRIMWL